jgi:hypothetical protein
MKDILDLIVITIVTGVLMRRVKDSMVIVHMGVLKALKDIDVIYQVNLNHIPIYILHVDVNTE